MKIGVLVKQDSPGNGGCHTFETMILESISELSSSSHHKFSFFTKGPEVPKKVGNSSLDIESIFSSKIDLKRWQIRRTAMSLYSKVRHPGNDFYIEAANDAYVAQRLKCKNIQMTFAPSPDYLTKDIPYITTIWDLQHRLQPFFPEISSGGTWQHHEKLYSKMLPRASVILTGTDTGKAEIKQFYGIPDERIVVLPFPTPFTIDEIDDSVLGRYEIPEDFIIYPALCWPHKNHANLFLALKVLADEFGIKIPLVLTDSKNYKKSPVYQMTKDFGLLDQVHFIGFVPQADLAALYRRAKALVYVTFFGPDNLPPLEAMSYGCPVIASEVSGAREQLSDAVLLVDPKDPVSIAMAIKKLLESPTERKKLIDKGYVRTQNWSPKDYVKQLFEIFDKFESYRRCWPS